MLGQLDLQDEDFHDPIVDDVEQEIQESVQWMAIARVHTEKVFSQSAFYGDMRAAWNLAQEQSE
jgi:beta-glucanase (GH16 family)